MVPKTGYRNRGTRFLNFSNRNRNWVLGFPIIFDTPTYSSYSHFFFLKKKKKKSCTAGHFFVFFFFSHFAVCLHASFFFSFLKKQLHGGPLSLCFSKPFFILSCPRPYFLCPFYNTIMYIIIFIYYIIL
jgi:hypothetical protein